MDDKTLQELIDNVLGGKTPVTDLTDAQFVCLMGGLKRMYVARVMNCVDASAKWDKEWLVLSSIFNRLTAAKEANNGALDIGWAIRGLKLGQKVRRRGWRDKRKFLWFKPPVPIQADWCKDPKLKKLAEDNGGAIDGLGTICMYLAVDDAPTILTGWHPTPCDLLAEDWEEVE